MLTNNRLTISRVVTAVNDPSRSEALREMMVDGVPLKEHPNLHLWTKKGDEFADIGTSAREKLDLPLKQKVTISHVIGMVKLFKTGS
ncbi:MAG TPA: hypothetical protein PKE58_17960 [Acidobacteriota bacterium]|nr:hypothetical protein [Acidobacteriota bacterium]